MYVRKLNFGFIPLAAEILNGNITLLPSWFSNNYKSHMELVTMKRKRHTATINSLK